MLCFMERFAIKFNGKTIEKTFRVFGGDYALSKLIVHMKERLVFVSLI